MVIIEQSLSIGPSCCKTAVGPILLVGHGGVRLLKKAQCVLQVWARELDNTAFARREVPSERWILPQYIYIYMAARRLSKQMYKQPKNTKITKKTNKLQNVNYAIYIYYKIKI